MAWVIKRSQVIADKALEFFAEQRRMAAAHARLAEPDTEQEVSDEKLYDSCDFCGAPYATRQELPDLRYPEPPEGELFSHWGHPMTGNVCRECAVKQMQMASGGRLVPAAELEAARAELADAAKEAARYRALRAFFATGDSQVYGLRSRAVIYEFTGQSEVTLFDPATIQGEEERLNAFTDELVAAARARLAEPEQEKEATCEPD